MSTSTLTLSGNKRKSDSESNDWTIKLRVIVMQRLDSWNYELVSANKGRSLRESGENIGIRTVGYGSLNDKRTREEVSEKLYMLYIVDAMGEDPSHAANCVADYLDIEIHSSTDRDGRNYWWRLADLTEAKDSHKPPSLNENCGEVPAPSDNVYSKSHPSSDPSENPWIEILGHGKEAETAYWNTH